MKWSVEIQNFLGGFAPAWYKETYPVYGNKNQAGTMQNIDLTNPGYMTQGPGLATLTAGTEAGAVTTLIKSIIDSAIATDTTYGVGGNKLHQISSTAVANSGIWPHTIDKAAVTGEDGEDVKYFQGNLYYSYNHSGSAGDIGLYNLNVTFTDAWGSVVPSGAAALTNNPHQMATSAGGSVLYIANGRYVASYDGSTFQATDLDFQTGSVVSSIVWDADRLWAGVNRFDLTGNNKNKASVFVWDGAASAAESEIKIMGRIGALFVKNGIKFVFYQDITSTGGYKLGYINGSSITDLANFSGGLPLYYQVSDYKDFIIWNSAGLVFAFGAGDKDMPIRLFQLASGGYTTIGAIACPFGTPMIASTQSTSYKLAQFSGYGVACNWKSLMFDITGSGRVSAIDAVRINFEQLTSGARVDWKLLNNIGRTIYSDTISYTKLGAITSWWYPIAGQTTENFRIEFDYTNGSTTAPVKIKNAKIYGSSD